MFTIFDVSHAPIYCSCEISSDEVTFKTEFQTNDGQDLDLDLLLFVNENINVFL